MFKGDIINFDGEKLKIVKATQQQGLLILEGAGEDNNKKAERNWSRERASFRKNHKEKEKEKEEEFMHIGEKA